MTFQTIIDNITHIIWAFAEKYGEEQPSFRTNEELLKLISEEDDETYNLILDYIHQMVLCHNISNKISLLKKYGLSTSDEQQQYQEASNQRDNIRRELQIKVKE